LLCVLTCDIPACGFATVNTYVCEVCAVECGAQNFDEVRGLGAGGEHGSVRSGKIRLIEESEVSYPDACGGVEVDVGDEVVGVGLFPVA
jgi:hypothetical protein